MSRLFCSNTREIYLASCLYDCIEDNNIRAVQQLLTENGANPNIIIPDRGITPFHLAIGNGVEKTAEEITRLFLDKGGNPNVRSDEKLTPVHIAAAWGRLTIFNILLKSGGDPTLRDDQGKTPLDYAKEEGHWDIVDQFENDLEPETQYDKLPYDITLDKVIINNGVLVAEYGVSGIDDMSRSLAFNLKTASAVLPELTHNSYIENWCVKQADIMRDSYIVNDLSSTDNQLVIVPRPSSLNSSDSDSFDDRRNHVTVRKHTAFNIDVNAKHHAKIPKKNLNICFDYSSSDENNLSKHCDYSPEKLAPYLNEKNTLNDSFKYISSEESAVHNKYSALSGIYTLPSDTSHNLTNSFSLKMDDLNVCFIKHSREDMKKSGSSSSDYLTCEEVKSVNSLEKNVIESMMTLDLSDKVPENRLIQPEITLDLSDPIENSSLTKNHVTNIPCQLSVLPEGPNESLVSVAEEYKYVDKEEGIVLIEKRILVNQKNDDNKSSTSSISCAASSLPSVIDYDTDTLRKELTIRGEPPGPITKTTKRVYLKKLKKLKKMTVYDPPAQTDCNRVYSVELEKTLRNPNWSTDLTSFKELELLVVNQFSNPEPAKRWREGLTKASFTYLLLDPRITNNLPARSEKLTSDDTWKTFLSAIFYVGKGKRSRPYSHLYEAVTYWSKGECNESNKKIKYILDIWRDRYGVICLHIFQNVIPVEAYTREAAMINALKLQNLCNGKSGDFYGVSSTWPERQKRLFGVYLLHRAMLIFLNEGERQLRPDDIGK